MKEPPKATSEIERLIRIMADLRDPDCGCPWDLKQTFATIAPYTIEEAYEVAEAIEHHDMPALKDELGDLLLQVVFHARMAEEAGDFGFQDVAKAICDKMVRRHPHVYADDSQRTAETQTLAWEDQKAAERAEKANGAPISVLDGVARTLPSLTRAYKLQRRAARVGFDWPDTAQVIDKIEEELAEIKEEIANGGDHERLREEVGDLLFAAANLARHFNAEPELALREANSKFTRRFHKVEEAFENGLEKVSLEEMERAWQDVKTREKTPET